MSTETRNDVTMPVAAFGLVLEPLTRKLARELSTEIANHCFTEDGEIRPEVSNLTVRLGERQQFVTAKMATDTDVHATLRYVRCVGLTISKRGEDKNEEQETKSKKVSPGAPVLRANLACLIDTDDAAIREFLMRRFGSTFFFQFEDELKQLDFGSAADDADDDEKPAKRQAKLALAPKPDPDAGDVLDEQEQHRVALINRVIAALADCKIELTIAKYRKLPDEVRTDLLAFLRQYEDVKEAKGDQVTMDDLPQPPASLFTQPKVTKATVAAIASAAAHTERQARAPRRSSSKFTNPPKLAGKKFKVTEGPGRKGRKAAR